MGGLRECDRTVVVAVVAVRVVQAAIDQVVDVVVVRDGVVSAVGAVLVAALVAAGRLGVAGRVVGAGLDHVFVDVVAVRVVQVPVVQVVDMIVVLDRGVAAVRPVDVLVASVDLVVRHGPDATPGRSRAPSSLEWDAFSGLGAATSQPSDASPD